MSENHPSVIDRAEALRVTDVESIDTDDECQTWYGPPENGSNQCGLPAKYEVTLENDYEQDDPVTMKVCPGCKRAYQSRGESA